MDFDGIKVDLGADISGLEAGLALGAAKLLNFAGRVGGLLAQAGPGFQAFVNRAGQAGTQAADGFAAGFNSVNSKIAASYADLEKSQEKYRAGFGKLGDSLTSLGTGLTAAVTAPLALLGGASLKTAGDMQALELGFRAVYKGAGDAGAALKQTQELAKLPGLGLAEAVQGSIRLQAVGFSAEDAAKSLRAFGNAIATTGGGKSDLDRVTVQLGQLAAKGKVLSQDLRPIIEAAPLVAESLKKLYGTVDSEDISKKLEEQGQSSKEFVAILTDELSKLPQVTGGLKNTFENFGDSVKLSLAKVGESINKSFNIESLVNGLADKLGGLAEAFAALSPTTQKFVLVTAGLAAALGPILVAVGALLTALPSMAAGFAILTPAIASTGAAFLAFATGPVGIAILAATALASTIYILATATEHATAKAVEQTTANRAQADTITSLVARYEELKLNTNRTAEEQAELVKIVQEVTKVVPEAGKGIDEYGRSLELNTGKAKAFVRELVNIDKSIAIKALPGAKKDLDDLQAKYDKLSKERASFEQTGKFTAGYAPGLNELEGFRDKVKQTTEALNKQKEAYQSLRVAAGQATKAGSGAQDNSLTNALSGGGGGNIQSTIETLEKLRKQRDDLVTKRDTTDALGSKPYADDSAEIKRLNELIAKYEALGKAAKKGVDEVAKAFAETNNKVAAVDVRVKLNLLTTGDALTEKIDVLTAGITKVTDLKVGFDDARLQKLTNQLTSLVAKKQQLDASFGKPLSALVVNKDVDKEILTKIQADLDKAKLKAKVEFRLTGDATKLAADLAAAQKQAQQSVLDGQVDPQNGQAKTISAGVKPLEIDAKNLDSLKQYKQIMSEITAQQTAFGAGFNASAAAMQATGQRLQELISLGKAGTPEFDALKRKFQELKLAADFDNVLKNAQTGFANLLADIGTVVTDNLAGIIVGTESVGDGLKNIFAGVLGAVGGFLVDLGKQLIVVGLLNSAFLAVSTNPALAPFAIAIGAAAIAAGSVFKAISSSASKSISSGGGGYSAPSISTGSSPTASVASRQNLNIQVSFDPIVLRADGEDMRATSAVGAYRIKRRN